MACFFDPVIWMVDRSCCYPLCCLFLECFFKLLPFTDRAATWRMPSLDPAILSPLLFRHFEELHLIFSPSFLQQPQQDYSPPANSLSTSKQAIRLFTQFYSQYHSLVSPSRFPVCSANQRHLLVGRIRMIELTSVSCCSHS